MQNLLADYATNLSELCADPKSVLNQAQEGAIVILDNNQPSAYLLPAALFEWLLALKPRPD